MSRMVWGRGSRALGRDALLASPTAERKEGESDICLIPICCKLCPEMVICKKTEAIATGEAASDVPRKKQS